VGRPITGRRFPVPVGIVSRHTASRVLEQAGCQGRFERTERRFEAQSTRRAKGMVRGRLLSTVALVEILNEITL
jgi:hypothetical protein